jgi:cell division initiation protein
LPCGGGEIFLEEEITMVISPMNIHLKEFNTVSTEGYKKEEVDSFLGAVADELERLTNRNKELEDMVTDMKQKVSQFDEMQQTLQNALMNAQKSAGNILQEARSQAAAIIKKAQERSDHILEDLEKEKKSMIESFTDIRNKIEGQIPHMRELMDKSQGLLKEYEESAKKADLAAIAEEGAAPTTRTETAKEETAEAEEAEEKATEGEEKHFGSQEDKYVWE